MKNGINTTLKNTVIADEMYKLLFVLSMKGILMSKLAMISVLICYSTIGVRISTERVNRRIQSMKVFMAEATESFVRSSQMMSDSL
jgi:hypothetical protein